MRFGALKSLPVGDILQQNTFYLKLAGTTNALMLLVISRVRKVPQLRLATPRGLWDGHACPPASVGPMAEPFCGPHPELME